ncbi:MAG TPA: amidase [Candidatus Baltobacteraceae bacterium]|nr:amidase [Candidatus Baltobacteraceae bacterium]
MSDDDLAFSGVVELQRLLTRRTVSSLELSELYLARLEKYGPVYNALVTLMPERARSEAKRADRERAAGKIRGPLHGIPYGVKDLLATVGAPTTWGAEPFRHQRFDFDATVVSRLGAAGGVLLAKLAMVELAGGFGYNEADATFTGPGRTPWNRKFWSGGSSSGSGAATAAGLVGFSIGSETSGSILFPATSCGVTGLRPTYGRVSRHGAMALCWTLDKLGPLARGASDTELVLRAIAGKDANDPTSVDAPFPAPRRRPRIAVLAKSTQKTMPAVKANFEAALKVLTAFCDIDEQAVALPHLPYGAAVQTIVDAEGAAAFRELIESGRARELRSPEDRTGGYSAYATLAIDYIDAQRQRTYMLAAFEKAFGAYDAIATPTLPTVAYPIDLPFDKAYPKYPGAVDSIAAGNLTGVPAIGFPNGFGENGLPTGMSLLGRPFCEVKLTRIVREYQTRTDFHTRRPKLTTTV